MSPSRPNLAQVPQAFLWTLHPKGSLRGEVFDAVVARYQAIGILVVNSQAPRETVEQPGDQSTGGNTSDKIAQR